MIRIEHRVPPPVLFMLCAGLIWMLSRMTAGAHLSPFVRYGLAIALSLIASLLGPFAFMQFSRARTTIDPVRIEGASSLVTQGVYQITRNPMYLGLTLLLAAWSVWLSSAYGLAVTALFAWFIDRFQIRPEERVLQARFGDAYTLYRRRVRRWI